MVKEEHLKQLQEELQSNASPGGHRRPQRSAGSTGHASKLTSSISHMSLHHATKSPGHNSHLVGTAGKSPAITVKSSSHNSSEYTTVTSNYEEPNDGKEYINKTYCDLNDERLWGQAVKFLRNRLRVQSGETLRLSRYKAMREHSKIARDAIDKLRRKGYWAPFKGNPSEDNSDLSAKSTPIFGVITADVNFEEGKELKEILDLEIKRFIPFCENRGFHLLMDDGLTPCKELWKPPHKIQFCQNCLELHMADTLELNTRHPGKCASQYHPSNIEPLFEFQELAEFKYGGKLRIPKSPLTCLFCKDHAIHPAEYGCPEILFRLQHTYGEVEDKFEASNKYKHIKGEIHDLKRFGLWHSSAHAHMSGGELEESDWVSATSNITFLAAYAMTLYREGDFGGRKSILCLDTSSIRIRVAEGWRSYKATVDFSRENSNENNHHYAKLFESEKEYLIYKGFSPKCVVDKVDLMDFLRAFPKPKKAGRYKGEHNNFKEYGQYFIKAFDLEPEGQIPTHQDLDQIHYHLSKLASDHDQSSLFKLFKRQNEVLKEVELWAAKTCGKTES